MRILRCNHVPHDHEVRVDCVHNLLETAIYQFNPKTNFSTHFDEKLQVDDPDENRFNLKRFLSLRHEVEPILLVGERQLVPFKLPHRVEQSFVLDANERAHRAECQQRDERLENESDAAVEVAGQNQNAARAKSVSVEGDDDKCQSARELMQPVTVGHQLLVSFEYFVQRFADLSAVFQIAFVSCRHERGQTLQFEAQPLNEHLCVSHVHERLSVEDPKARNGIARQDGMKREVQDEANSRVEIDERKYNRVRHCALAGLDGLVKAER